MSTKPAIDLFEEIPTNASNILNDNQMKQLQDEIKKRFGEESFIEPFCYFSSKELAYGKNINDLRKTFLAEAKDYNRTIVIIKHNEDIEFGFFVPDVWEDTTGQPDINREFYSPF